MSKELGKRGLTVIDADEISKEVCEEQVIKEQILRQFGTTNPKQLREIVFADLQKKTILEQIIHPVVVERIIEAIVDAYRRGQTKVVVDAPLLIETGVHNICDQVLVLSLDRETQLSRLVKRSPHLSPEQAERIIESQISDEDRTAQATTILNNNGSITDLIAQIDSNLGNGE